MFYPCPQLRLYFHDGNGHPLVGGKLKTFVSNSTIPIRTVQTYRNAEGTVLNPTEITLDERGECTVFLTAGVIYRFELYDSDGALVLEQDGISVASGSGSGGSSTTIAVESGSDGIDVQQTIMDSGVVIYTISAKKIEDAIEAEKNRAESAESALSKSIADETERATKAEKVLADAIETEKNRAEEAERTISESISKETERAIAAEKASRTEIVAGDNITVEKTVGADGQDVYTVIGESEDNLVDDVRVNGASVVTDKVANIDVPVAGTASPLMDGKASVGNSLKYAREGHVHPTDTSREDIANKTTVVLGTSDSKYPTDKAVAEFVNSSIATNTANYISNNGEPFTSVEQLEAYSGHVTNNDYAFVTGTDSDGNTYYDRYKATVSGETVTWALEYRLNNSSFTAAQWSAINSGITSVLVAKIHTHSNKDVLDVITSSDVANWNSKQNSLTAGDNITIDGSTISSDQVFVATYGNTKYQEIKYAYDAGKICICRYKDNTSGLLYAINNSEIRFAYVNPYASSMVAYFISNKNVWSIKIANLQNKLTFDDEPKAGSKNPVTSNGIKTAIDTIDAKGITVKEISGEQVICFE